VEVFDYLLYGFERPVIIAGRRCRDEYFPASLP
jgi:hypothetical protein